MSDENNSIKKKQYIVGGVAAAALVAAAGLYIFDGDSSATNQDRADNFRKRKMADVINPPSLDDTFLARTNTQFSQMQTQIDTLVKQVGVLSEENQNSKLEASEAKAELQRTRIEAETLIEEIATQAASQTNPGIVSPAPQPSLPSAPIGDPFARRGVVSPANAAGQTIPQSIPEPAAPRTVEVIQFKPALAKLETDAVQPAVFQTRNGDYVPPNAYAKATVLVGVDMTTGVRLGSDPKPVLLRITGPAYSVLQGGRQLDTDLTGCLVNGAANAELSSERVFIKLQKITCDRGGGEIAENFVEGYISQTGRVGVRGRVVSREGDIAYKALIAGTLSGIGNGVSRASEFGFAGVSGGATTVIGSDRPNAGEIAGGAFGEGISSAADNVADYLIERAEQYEPVIEMPTGIDVEIVFLNGFYARGSE